jgi:zinc protease
VANLAAVLALEAERMQATCEQLDDALLERERAVVLAEEGQRDSAGLALAYQVNALAYGADHPYARPIASTEVARATRADVCAFIEAHYTPQNAYLVVTGPATIGEARALVGRTFGRIPQRPLTPAPASAVPDFHGQEERARAPLEHPTALVMFNLPRWGATGALPYAMARRLLAAELDDADDELPWIVGTGTLAIGGSRAPVMLAYVEVADPARLARAFDELFRRTARLRSYDDFDASPLVSGVLLEQMTRWDDLSSRGAWIADFLQYADHRWFMLEDLRMAAEGWRPPTRSARAPGSPTARWRTSRAWASTRSAGSPPSRSTASTACSSCAAGGWSSRRRSRRSRSSRPGCASRRSGRAIAAPAP